MVDRLNNPRRKTLDVNIGGIPMGSEYPVRIQSMANTLTCDVGKSVEQCIRIALAGADYVRFTVPSLTDAEALGEIKSRLRKKGYGVPLIADVHFNPDIALKVADYADKVRINPGNFGNPDRFITLIEKCRSRNVAVRIGVNHGSLSQDIMDRYGDTPEGMAESAMEYLRISQRMNFEQVVVSMKSSNVRVMIYATRLIADMMDREGMYYPLHLGVTEAGEGEDGRIKSAVGIGTLLAEGLGDTIRVSLTEEPEAEIPVARLIIRSVTEGQKIRQGGEEPPGDEAMRRKSDGAMGRLGERENGRYVFIRRKSTLVGNIGGGLQPVVIGFDQIDPKVRLVSTSFSDLNKEFISGLTINPYAVLVYTPSDYNVKKELDWLRFFLEEKECHIPVIIRKAFEENSAEDFMIRSSVWLGGALIDGFGDGLWLENKYPLGRDRLNSVSLGILQACRARMSKTEFISCPSCGRTHFNLIDALSRIRAATGHLKGLKIGVMGCIVNGPGEMADADYGYVGSGRGKITLYKSREVVKKGIPEERAVEELISLIKENGDWNEV